MHILKLSIITLLFSALTLGAAPAMAGDIGVINIQKILQESKAAKSVRKQLQAKQKEFQKELGAKQKKLLEQDKKLVEQRNKISKEAFEKKVKEFQKSANEAQRTIQKKKAALDKGFAQALNTIQTKISNIAAKIAKEKGLDVIIAASQIVYADSKLDVTSAVLSKLNAEMSTIKVNVKY
jgi:Skp family chaperone for outer membrane proteins